MLRKSVLQRLSLYLNSKEQKRCLCIANFVLLQCFGVLLIGATVVNCTWDPALVSFDPYKLGSIMYLYDKGVCEMNCRHTSMKLQNLKFSNDTKGFNVLPIRWKEAVVTVSTRLSQKTRNYVTLSMMFHTVWVLLTIGFIIIVKSNKNTRLIDIAINVYFFSFLFITIFDLSMAIVYMTHINRALTKGMIIRQSGWSVELKIKNNHDFAGYLPIIAAGCWMKGVVILALNIYSCKKINDIRFKIKQKLIMTDIHFISQKPLPNYIEEQSLEARTLYYRAGERTPYKKFIL